MAWIDVDLKVAEFRNRRPTRVDRDALSIQIAFAMRSIKEREVVVDVERLEVVDHSRVSDQGNPSLGIIENRHGVGVLAGGG